MPIMHDPHKTRHVLRRLMLQAGAEVGPGSWEAQVESELTPDGKTMLVTAAIPMRGQRGVPATPGALMLDDAGVKSPGRPSEVAKALMTYLKAHPESHQRDIVAAMAELGFSTTATNANLKVLTKMGLIAHPEKGGTYNAADLSKD
jgi:hypothetical protein